MPRVTTSRLAPALAFAALLAVIGIALPVGTHDGYRASVDVEATGKGTAFLTVRLSPKEIAQKVAWFNVIAWQGGSRQIPGTGLAIVAFEELRPGVYKTRQAVPVSGEWKTLIRIATSTTLQAVPVYLPEDKAIPAALVPALPHFDRPFVADQSILQREAVGGSPALKHLAYAILGVLAMLWIATLSLGLQRINRSALTQISPLTLGRDPIRRTRVSVS